MGTSLNENDSKQIEYKNSIHKLGMLVVHRILRPWLYPPAFFALSPLFWTQKALIRTLQNFTANVIIERKKNFSEETHSTPESDDGLPHKKRLAMLDLLLSAKTEGFSITDDGIREEVDTFMFEASL